MVQSCIWIIKNNIRMYIINIIIISLNYGEVLEKLQNLIFIINMWCILFKKLNNNW